MTKDQVKLEIDLSTMMGAYNPKEYIKECVIRALKENPKIIGEVIQTYILTDLLKSDEYQKVKEAVRVSMSNLTADTLEKTATYKSAVNVAVNEAVNEAKPKINQVVALKINSEGFKQGVAQHISSIVEKRVMSALGEVCDGCGRDTDYY
jgi:hypothetical protein